MSIPGIDQPQIIPIDPSLRLRKYTDDCAFALAWYQDAETLLLVDGAAVPYDTARLYRMYHYLQARGEVYFIEVRPRPGAPFCPIGDVTFLQEDMPIVIGDKAYRGKGIGKKVITALIRRAVSLGFPYLAVAEIYDCNAASRRLFESAGFHRSLKTAKGHSWRLEL